MAPKLILHIGANKTGSSAIQSFLRLNAKLLFGLGYLVPDRELGTSDRVTGEHVFAFQDIINHSNRARLESTIRLLLKSEAKAIILSAENLSNGANFQMFNKFLSTIECQIVLYIRRQDELLTSSWQQWHSKTEVDFEAWLVTALQRYGHWQRCIDGWENVAGPGSVTVRIFQKAELANNDVVDDFISLLNVGEAADTFTRPPALVNPSYSDLITPLVSGNKFIFKNEHDNDFYHMVKELTGDHYALLQKVSLITRGQRERIDEFYRPQNQAICKRFFPGRPRLFDAIDHSKYDYLSAEELIRRQMGFLASLVYAMYKR